MKSTTAHFWFFFLQNFKHTIFNKITIQGIKGDKIKNIGKSISSRFVARVRLYTYVRLIQIYGWFFVKSRAVAKQYYNFLNYTTIIGSLFRSGCQNLCGWYGVNRYFSTLAVVNCRVWTTNIARHVYPTVWLVEFL